MPKTPTLPKVRKRHIEHKIADTKESQAALGRFATSLRTLRIRQGYSLKSLAEKVGCSYQQIGNIENRQHWPSMSTYLAICRALGQPRPTMT